MLEQRLTILFACENAQAHRERTMEFNSEPARHTKKANSVFGVC